MNFDGGVCGFVERHLCLLQSIVTNEHYEIIAFVNRDYSFPVKHVVFQDLPLNLETETDLKSSIR